MSSHMPALVAYQCGLGMGSVSQIGWEWYRRLAERGPVTLYTHVRNREALQAAGAPLHGSTVHYIDTEWFAGPLYRFAKRLFPGSEHSVFLLSSLDYFVFDFTLYRQLRRARRHGEALPGLIHRVTPVTHAAPTWLGRLGVPLLLGPLNSGLSDPPGFAAIMRRESTWLLHSRRLTSALDLLMGSTRRAARILVASAAARAAVPARYHDKCLAMLENGVDLTRFQATPWPALPSRDNPLRVLFVGRLVPVKGLDLLLQAVARIAAGGASLRLDIVGDGPLRAEWSALAARLGLEHCVHFHGAASQADVAGHMAASHLLCLPSVRESGGAVLLEAMACARPVIGFNYGGPGEIIDERIGARLAMDSPDQAIDQLEMALRDALRYPLAWARRGIEARRRVAQRYAWQAKIADADVLYRELTDKEASLCEAV
jgi:glycosyltransferase involved in cell wall biosynthesis